MRSQVRYVVASAALITSACSGSSLPQAPQQFSCAGVPAAAAGQAGSIDVVSSEAVSLANVCSARDALAKGEFVVSYTDDALIAAANGEPTASDTFLDGQSSVLERGAAPLPIDKTPTQAQEAIHVYGVYVGPRTSAEYTLSAGANTLTEAQTDVASWVSATLGEENAQRRVAAQGSVARKDFVGPPSYNSSAWSLVASETVEHEGRRTWQLPNHPLFPAQPPNSLGRLGEVVKVYRLNTRAPSVDDFLVDTYYTQTPHWTGMNPVDAKLYGFLFYTFWWNNATTVDVSAINAWDGSVIAKIVDFAPQTPITSTETTQTVGRGLSKYANYTEYSVKTVQPSVNTTVQGTLGAAKVRWVDGYADVEQGAVLNLNPPGTTISTFAGDRLVIFEVPRTINDLVPAGAVPSLRVDTNVKGEVSGFISRGPFNVAIGGRFQDYMQNAVRVYGIEPVFQASPTSITVSISKNSATNPAVVNVTAERANTSEKITWHAVQTPPFLTTNVDQNSITGSGQLKLVPHNAQVGQSGFVTLNSVPPNGSDSLRSGSYQIAVTVVQ